MDSVTLTWRGEIRAMRQPPGVSDSMVLWGIRVRLSREALGLQQADLAEIGGVKPGTVSAWENGRSPPTQFFLMRYGDVYGIDPAYILQGRVDRLDAEIRQKVRVASGR